MEDAINVPDKRKNFLGEPNERIEGRDKLLITLIGT
jgi:hypothetical protein